MLGHSNTYASWVFSLLLAPPNSKNSTQLRRPTNTHAADPQLLPSGDSLADLAACDVAVGYLLTILRHRYSTFHRLDVPDGIGAPRRRSATRTKAAGTGGSR